MGSIIQDHYVTTGKFPVFDHNMPVLYSSRKFARYTGREIPFRPGVDLAKWLFRMRNQPHRNQGYWMISPAFRMIPWRSFLDSRSFAWVQSSPIRAFSSM